MLENKKYFISGDMDEVTELVYTIGYYGSGMIMEISRWFTTNGAIDGRFVELSKSEKLNRLEALEKLIGKRKTEQLMDLQKLSLTDAYNLLGDVIDIFMRFIDGTLLIYDCDDATSTAIEDLSFYCGELCRSIESGLIYRDFMGALGKVPKGKLSVEQCLCDSLGFSEEE